MFKQTICKRLEKLEESVSGEEKFPYVCIDLRAEKRRLLEDPVLMEKWMYFSGNEHPSSLPDYF